MRLLAWSIETDTSKTLVEAKHLLDTASKFKQHVEFVGQGIEYNMLKDKLHTLKDYLNTVDDETLIICIDGYDTLINSDLKKLETIYEQSQTQIIISAERLFTYQWGNYKDKFEKLQSPYKYVNSGTLVGKSKYLKKMLEECLELSLTNPTSIDQGLVGIWVYNNIDDPKKVKLDTDCTITWVVSDEWGKLKKLSDNWPIVNPYTNTTPLIIHSPGNKAQYHFECFQEAYKNIMRR